MKNLEQNLVGLNFVFRQHALYRILKHFHSLFYVDSMSPVVHIPCWNGLAHVFIGPRVPLCRINFTRAEQHKPMKSFVPRAPVRFLTRLAAVVGVDPQLLRAG